MGPQKVVGTGHRSGYILVSGTGVRDVGWHWPREQPPLGVLAGAWKRRLRFVDTLARPGCRKKGRRGKTQYDPGRSRGSGVTVQWELPSSCLLGSRFGGGSFLAKREDGFGLKSIHISRVPVRSWFLSRMRYSASCSLVDSIFRVSRLWLLSVTRTSPIKRHAIVTSKLRLLSSRSDTSASKQVFSGGVFSGGLWLYYEISDVSIDKDRKPVSSGYVAVGSFLWNLARYFRGEEPGSWSRITLKAGTSWSREYRAGMFQGRNMSCSWRLSRIVESPEQRRL